MNEPDDLRAGLDRLAEQRPALGPGLVEAAEQLGARRVRQRRVATVVAAAAVVAVLGVTAVAVDGDDPSGTAPPADRTSDSAPDRARTDLPIELVDGEPLLTCGGGSGWPAEAMTDGIASSFDDAEARETFAELLDDPEVGGELSLSFLFDGIDTEYRVLAETDEYLLIGTGSWTVDGPQGEAYVMDLARTPDGWEFGGGSSCALLGPVLRPGLAWARVTRPHPDPADPLRVEVSVNELQCTSARDPRPFLHPPAVVETDTSVTVYWTSTPMVGGATCQGNPSVRRELVLDRPLADRALLDGSVWPPRPVGQPD